MKFVKAYTDINLRLKKYICFSLGKNKAQIKRILKIKHKIKHCKFIKNVMKIIHNQYTK